MDLISTIAAIPGIGPYMPYVLVAIAACSAIATILPPPGADASQAYRTIYSAVNWIAINKGHAANATAPK